jgi:hypothetical protein
MQTDRILGIPQHALRGIGRDPSRQQHGGRSFDQASRESGGGASDEDKPPEDVVELSSAPRDDAESATGDASAKLQSEGDDGRRDGGEPHRIDVLA